VATATLMAMYKYCRHHPNGWSLETGEYVLKCIGYTLQRSIR
jgi:hypothetical protein